MIRLLGKRPFSRGDEMDKWLEENSPERSAPPPLEKPAEIEASPEGAPAIKPVDKDLTL